MDLSEKLSRLKEIILKYKSCLIAFSAGVDSTFLLKVATEVLPRENVLAVTAVSCTYPREELLFAREIATQLRARHRIIRTAELKDTRFTANPLNRCYYCKEELFVKLKKLAHEQKIEFVLDASNIDDLQDYRPGNKAKRELKICSPLVEAGFDKESIRRLSRKMGLKSWDKPALACLASRVAYGVVITAQLLGRVDKGERLLKKIGLRQVRLRHYNSLCRIEVDYKQMPLLMKKRSLVVRGLKKIGYNYVTMDLEGYRTGSMNEVIKK